LSAAPLLCVEDLRVGLAPHAGGFDVLRGISFAVARGEKVGIVGESGSGKSMTALSLLGLLPRPMQVRGGAVRLEGEDILAASAERLRCIRGTGISMVFQDPMSSLNPVRSIGRQLTEGMAEHLSLSPGERRSRALELLRRVRVPRPEQILDSHPHQLSGGMRQRVAIAMALACRPKLLVADEPTTALDVTVQAEVMSLLQEVTADDGTAVVLISHSLDLVASFCDRIVVMYAGRVVEAGETRDVVRRPCHPYTADLIGSSPDIEAPRMRRFSAIAGQPPAVHAIPSGCAYHPRCRLAAERCRTAIPGQTEVDGRAACWFPGDKSVASMACA
jgi:oligopeptide/dipeptide ABC transporter ATP-binding protein